MQRTNKTTGRQQKKKNSTKSQGEIEKEK